MSLDQWNEEKVVPEWWQKSNRSGSEAYRIVCQIWRGYVMFKHDCQWNRITSVCRWLFEVRPSVPFRVAGGSWRLTQLSYGKSWGTHRASCQPITEPLIEAAGTISVWADTLLWFKKCCKTDQMHLAKATQEFKSKKRGIHQLPSQVTRSQPHKAQFSCEIQKDPQMSSSWRWL